MRKNLLNLINLETFLVKWLCYTKKKEQQQLLPKQIVYCGSLIKKHLMLLLRNRFLKNVRSRQSNLFYFRYDQIL